MLAIDNIRFGIGLDMGICILSENYILWGLRFGGFGKKVFGVMIWMILGPSVMKSCGCGSIRR
jgi:hypothetical protein